MSAVCNSKPQRDPSFSKLCGTCLPAQSVVDSVTVSAKQAGLGHCGHPFLPQRWLVASNTNCNCCVLKKCYHRFDMPEKQCGECQADVGGYVLRCTRERAGEPAGKREYVCIDCANRDQLRAWLRDAQRQLGETITNNTNLTEQLAGAQRNLEVETLLSNQRRKDLARANKEVKKLRKQLDNATAQYQELYVTHARAFKKLKTQASEAKTASAAGAAVKDA